jgi:cytochrome P450
MTNNLVNERTPVSNIDPYSDEALIQPWPLYEELQSLGSAVWLAKYNMFALTRYDSVSRALKEDAYFSSASGVMMNDKMNQVLRGNTLCSDGEEHQRLRRIIARPLTPAALKSLRAEVTQTAELLVTQLVEKRNFCAVTELATPLPVAVVASAVGLPEEGRERMLSWGEDMFNCFGPMNDRTRDSFPALEQMMHYATTQAVRGKLKSGSWAEAILDAADRGEVCPAACPAMMIDYMGPSLDTTISAIASGVWLFANNPDEWEKVRASPYLVPNAINEILRIETPLQSFSRFLTSDYTMNEVVLPAGSRAIVFFGAANRDKRKYLRPEEFRVDRSAADHLGFGSGPHVCVGLHLAKLEMNAIFTALAARVRRFHVREEVRSVHNVLRGFKKLMVSVE